MDLSWFRSLHFGQNDPNANIVLWWAVWPDRRLHIVAEQRRQNCTIAALARDMRTRTRELGIEAIRYTVADEQSIGKDKGEGESRAETFRANGIPVRVLKIDAAQGWTRVKELLGARPDGRPWLTIDPSCAHVIRALTTAIKDDTDPEQVATSPAMQPLNALRVGAMSRPAPNPFEAPPRPPNAIGHLVDEIRNGGRGGFGVKWRSA